MSTYKSSLEQPILLLGATRSGKTLVARTLCELPQFSILSEPITIWNIGKARREDDCRTAEEATPRTARRIRSEIERRCRKLGSPRIVDDLPHNTFRIPFCRIVLPDAKYIFVMRDGRTTVPAMLRCWTCHDPLISVLSRKLPDRHVIRLSALPPHAFKWILNYVRLRFGARRATWGPTVPGQRAFSKTHSLAETVAYQWSKMIEFALNGIASLPPDRATTVRSEDLFTKPDEMAERLAQFVDIGDVAALASAIRTATASSSSRNVKVELSEDKWKAIMPIIEPMQQRLGYQ